jgi:glycosyltransferase involved in cell wall biosynthesis
MSSGPGLRLVIGGAGRHSPAFLNVGAYDHADVPCSYDDLPFEDRVADAIAVDRFIVELPPGPALCLLLECRRVLRPGGLVRLDLGRAVPYCVTGAVASGRGEQAHRVGAARTVELAGIAGFDSARDAPLRAGAREAIAALDAAERDRSSVELTKRERRLDDDPLVSILIPAYNARFFAACLDSALAQTYAGIEIVVCDDSPGPAIEAIVHDRSRARVIRYERNETRLGPRGNFIRCFERAHGAFVKFLCDDDLLAPACVERLLDAFRRAPDVTLATSRRRRIDDAGTWIGDQPATRPIVPGSAVIAGYTLANAMLMAGLNTIGEPSTTLFRKSDFTDASQAYFHFDGAPGRGIIDMVMWASLLLKGDAVYLEQRLSSFRVHAGQRQHDPVTRRRSIDSIRELQAAWLALQISAWHPPDTLRVQPFPPDGRDWRSTPIRGFAARKTV